MSEEILCVIFYSRHCSWVSNGVFCAYTKRKIIHVSPTVTDPEQSVPGCYTWNGSYSLLWLSRQTGMVCGSRKRLKQTLSSGLLVHLSACITIHSVWLASATPVSGLSHTHTHTEQHTGNMMTGTGNFQEGGGGGGGGAHGDFISGNI